MNKLTCKCVPRLDGASAVELGRIFPEPSITAPLLPLLQESGIDGFNLRSIVVSKDDVPILLLPLFECLYDLSTFAKGWTKKSLKAAASLIPSIFHPRILGVGLLEGGWSEIGIDPHLDAVTLGAAWEAALGALQILATESKSDVVAFYNFNHHGKLPDEVLETFNRVPWLPCARLPITFNSLEEYLSRLSRAARKDLRRKMRVSHEVRVVRSRNISPFLDRIYKLYLETVERGPTAFGVHNRLFLEKICERVQGAEYMLYFVQDELAAFNLLIVKQEAMVDKYFCMNYELGRKYNLYVLSWLENLRTCVEEKIPVYQAGQGAEKTKAHMGATFIPSLILFRHRRPVYDRFLFEQPAVIGRIIRYLGLWPGADRSTPLPQSRIGDS
ncbi:MAG: GNAT family N-acetyltransferase [Thermodesulfovibrionales bacterium]|nr:GNAT family N-acetyltransferase [Thermodesulfovibrionales bacterium]